jgi:hypothetical protein
MVGEMSLLDRLRADRPATTADRPAPPAATASPGRRGGLVGRLDLAREHAIRSHEPQGWLGGVLIGAWSALLSLLAVALPLLLVWATSTTSTSWGEAVRVATQGWLLVHGVALEVAGGSLHLLPLGLTALPSYLCWRGGRRLARSVVGSGTAGLAGALRSVGAPVAGLAAGYAFVLVVGALLAGGGGVRPVWWHAAAAGLALPLLAGGAAALRTSAAESSAARRRRPLAVLADWLHLPARARRALRPAFVGVGVLVVLGVVLVVLAVLVQHRRVLAVHSALDPGGLGTLVLSLGQLALLPNLALWGVAWFAGPGFAVGAGTVVTPAASTLGMLPLVPVLGALPSPGPLPEVAQAAVLVPVVIGAVVGWRCTRAVGAHEEASAGHVVSAVLDAVIASVVAAVALTVLVMLSSGSAGPGQLTDVGPSAWRVGLALLGELAAGATVTAWILARRN